MLDPITMAVLSMLAAPPPALVWCLPAASVQDDAKAAEAVEKIMSDYSAEQAAFRKKLNSLESDEERQRFYDEESPDPAKYFTKLHEIARDNPRSDAAAKAASFVLSMSRRSDPNAPETAWALDMLLDDFMDSDQIADVPQMCSGMTSRNIEALERIRNNTNHEVGKARADYFRGSQLIMLGKAAQELAEEGSSGDPYMSYYMEDMDDELKEKLKGGDADAYRSAGVKLFEHCKTQYADVELYSESGIMVASLAEGALFEMHSLQIGQRAPDIEGVDAEGVTFHLSDYLGQVVLLDFWGFW